MTKVFVYGTLRKGFGNHYLLADGLFLGVDCVKGRMYSLGGCPAVDLDEGGIVHGEVYLIDARIFKNLDNLESAYFRRIVRSGNNWDVWVYGMSGLGRYPCVEDGVWKRKSLYS